MGKLRKVAITGGLACGKSSVCDIFRKLGAYVVSADEIVHQLLSPKTALGQNIVALLGADIVVNGKIDRTVVAKKVFNHPTLLHSLEELLHPAVLKAIDKLYQEVKNDDQTKLFIAEIPLLFEVGAEVSFDTTIAVIADPTSCQERFHASTGLDKEEYNKRMSRQLKPEEKAKRADYVIQNDGSKQHLYDSVVRICSTITDHNDSN